MSMLESVKESISKYKDRFFIIGYKKKDVENEIELTIEKNKSEISYFPLSANTIKIFDYCGEKVFFRECRKHESIDVYLKKSFDEFYLAAEQGMTRENFLQDIPVQTFYSHDAVESFRRYVEKCSGKKDFFERIKNIKFYLKKCQFNIWAKSKIIPPEIMYALGFSELPEGMVDIFAYFITFIKSAVVNYYFHDFCKNGQYESYFANKSLATYHLAKLMRLERLVVPTKFVKLIDGNEASYGVLCVKAPGIRAFDCSFEMTPSLHRELSNLKVLDALCMQPDHWVNNYNVVLDDNGRAVSVCAFDNDNNWCFMPFGHPTFYSKCGGDPLFDRNGLFRLPHLDKETANRILQVHSEDLNNVMSHYLNIFQLKALHCRLRFLQKAIRKTCRVRSDFLVDAENWSANFIDSELQGAYGRTYAWQYQYKDQIRKECELGRNCKDFKYVW